MPSHRLINLNSTERPRPTYRFLGHVSPAERERTPLLEDDTTGTSSTGPSPTQNDGTAVIRLYDVIDSWGGPWGVSAQEFLGALDQIGEDVDTIELHINSPGGEVWDAVAIYNALINHPAGVNVVIDGLAASAAGLIAMAGDTITMNPATQMMIHDARSLAIGNAADLRDTATKLDKMCDQLAAIYQAQAGGKATDWRAVMKAETWYTPKEALDAGLITAIAKKQKSTNASPQNKFDLSMFMYAGREQAPPPTLDTTVLKTRASVSGSSKNGQENNRVDQSELAESIGLSTEATQDEINARLAELMSIEASDEGAKPDEDADEDKGADEESGDTPPLTAPAPTPTPEASPKAFAPPAGTKLVDEAQWQVVQSAVAEMNKMRADNARKDRDDYMVAAMSDGKFPPAQRSHYEKLWAADPAATKALIDVLEPNKVPVAATGHGTSAAASSEDDAYPASWANSLNIKGANI